MQCLRLSYLIAASISEKVCATSAPGCRTTPSWRAICDSEKTPRTRENLLAAIEGETGEYTEMYPGMAKTAREEGFPEVADWFETLAKAERSHAGRFSKALAELPEPGA